MSAAVGADIAALCSKCGDVWHVIVAKVGEDIVKVQCKECGGYHRYRHPSKAAVKKAAAARTAAPRAVVQRFEAPAVAADLSRPVKPYSPSEKCEVGDRVEHPTFGTGTVEVIDGAKMTVFFAVGRKVLVHAGTAAAGLTRPKPFDYTGQHAGKPVNQE